MNLYIYAKCCPTLFTDQSGKEAAHSQDLANPTIIKRDKFTGDESQDYIRQRYAAIGIHYKGDAVWNEQTKSWFVDRSHLTRPVPKAHGTSHAASHAESHPSSPPAAPSAAPAPAAPQSTATPGQGATPPPGQETAADKAVAFAGGAAKGLLAGVAGAVGIGIVAGLTGIAAGTIGLALAPFALAYGAYQVAEHWDEIKATTGRLLSGQGTAKDWGAAGNVVGSIASIPLAGGATEAGTALGGVVRQGIADAAGSILSSEAGGAAATEASLRFTQTTASPTFRNGPFAGRTIGDLAGALRSGAVKPSELPVDIISRGGNKLILNTRSALALIRGGVSPAEWVVNDVTGNPFFEQILSERLAGNSLTGAGTEVLRITGAGRSASSLR